MADTKLALPAPSDHFSIRDRCIRPDRSKPVGMRTGWLQRLAYVWSRSTEIRKIRGKQICLQLHPNEPALAVSLRNKINSCRFAANYLRTNDCSSYSSGAAVLAVLYGRYGKFRTRTQRGGTNSVRPLHPQRIEKQNPPIEFTPICLSFHSISSWWLPSV